jgi:hypothetical protein
MKFKRSQLFIAVALMGAFTAQAQILNASDKGASPLMISNDTDTVRLYGLIDLTLGQKNNANSAGKSQFDMPVAFFSGNRWGIDGSHALPNTGGSKRSSNWRVSMSCLQETWTPLACSLTEMLG